VIVKGSETLDLLDEETLKERARALLSAGHSKKDILGILSQESGFSRNEIYRILIGLD